MRNPSGFKVSLPRFLASLLVCAELIISGGLAPAFAAQSSVTVVDTGTHYNVAIDLEHGATHRRIGEEYGKAILGALPNYEQILDSYIAEACHHRNLLYLIMIHRVHQIRKQMQSAYRDEIDGIASSFSGAEKNKLGDGKVSHDELYMLNLLADIARLNQCCAVAAFGSHTPGGTPICGRNLDWPDGKQNQLAKIQAVTTFKDGDKSLVSIACLGYIGAISGFNCRRVFAAVLDSGTGKKYSARNKRSYAMDLREALETAQSIDELAKFMIDPDRKYAFNHLVFLADAHQAAVLENDISGYGQDIRRALRKYDSNLRPGVTWGIPDTIGSVNCFMLKGNDDNHIDPWDERRFEKAREKDPDARARDINTPRWLAMQGQLKMLGDKITADGLKLVLGEHHGDRPGSAYVGDLYNRFTEQSIIFDPANFALQVFFHPRQGGLPAKPTYENVPIEMDAR